MQAPIEKDAMFGTSFATKEMLIEQGKRQQKARRERQDILEQLNAISPPRGRIDQATEDAVGKCRPHDCTGAHQGNERESKE